MNRDSPLTLASRPASRIGPGWAALAIVGLGLTLRVFLRGHQSFWTDEILTMDAASGEPGDLSRMLVTAT